MEIKKMDKKTHCCTCWHYNDTDGNDGELTRACDICDGKTHYSFVKLALNCRECKDIRCIHNKK